MEGRTSKAKLVNAAALALMQAEKLVSDAIKKTKLDPDSDAGKLMYEFRNVASKEKGQVRELEAVLMTNKSAANAAAAPGNKLAAKTSISAAPSSRNSVLALTDSVSSAVGYPTTFSAAGSNFSISFRWYEVEQR